MKLLNLGFLFLAASASSAKAESQETFTFETEVNKVMDIIIHSLYKTKDVFLRELISNSADALDKIRFQSLTDANALKTAEDLKITIKADKDEKTLTIRDTGVGMTKEALKNNLGTIAKSGTAEFLKQMEKANASDPGLIGKFGVGFYSAFLVADKVEVVSKNNDDDQYIWESSSSTNNYKITKDPRGNTLGRGTEIILHLKEDAYSFLEEKNMEQIIKKHSEFINFPIYVWSESTIEEEVPEEVETAPEDNEEGVKDAEEEEVEKKPKTVTKVVQDWKLVNENKPIWTRPISEVTEEEHFSFFKSHFKESVDPLAYTHFKLEGDNRFTGLIYIPASPPKNFLQPDSPNLNSFQLFVRRVFITDELNDLIPRWLSFIKVIIDSDDMPLNVSRETLQNHASLKIIKNRIVTKALALLADLAEKEPEVYQKIHSAYAKALRYGYLDAKAKHQEQIKELLRFETSNLSGVSFKEYVENMKEGQPQIYYASGTSAKEIKESSLVEKVIKRGFEVLLVVDPLEDYVLADRLKSYKDIPLQNVAKDGLKFGDEDEDSEKIEKDIKEKFEPLQEWLKDQLDSVVSEVRISLRLASAPCVVVPSLMGLTAQQEKLMNYQNAGKEPDMMAKFYLDQKKILEINPYHPLMKALLKKIEAKDTDKLQNFAPALYEIYLVASGFEPKSLTLFSSRVEKLLREFAEVDLDEKADDSHIVKSEKPKAKKVEKKVEVAEKDGEEDHDEL